MGEAQRQPLVQRPWGERQHDILERKPVWLECRKQGQGTSRKLLSEEYARRFNLKSLGSH